MLSSDLRFAVRSLSRKPAFTTIVITTLGTEPDGGVTTGTYDLTFDNGEKNPYWITAASRWVFTIAATTASS